MKRHLLLILTLSITALLLAGCFTVDQEMWINADGSGKMKLDMGMSEALLSMAGEEANQNPVSEMEGEMASNPNIKNIKTNEYSKDGMKHFSIEFEIADFNKFIEEEAKNSGEMTMTITKMDNGNYLFKQNLNMGDAASSGMDPEALSGLGVNLDNLFWTVTMHVPQVINTNGEKQGNDIVVWKIPIKDMLSGTAPKELTLEYSTASAGGFNFDFSTDDPTTVLAIIGSCLCCLLVIVIIVVVVVVIMRRKKQQQQAQGY